MTTYHMNTLSTEQANKVGVAEWWHDLHSDAIVSTEGDWLISEQYCDKQKGDMTRKRILLVRSCSIGNQSSK